MSVMDFALGLAGMSEKEIADVKAGLPIVSDLAEELHELEPILAKAMPHLLALKPMLAEAMPILQKAWPQIVAVTPLLQEMIAFAKSKA